MVMGKSIPNKPGLKKGDKEARKGGKPGMKRKENYRVRIERELCE